MTPDPRPARRLRRATPPALLVAALLAAGLVAGAGAGHAVDVRRASSSAEWAHEQGHRVPRVRRAKVAAAQMSERRAVDRRRRARALEAASPTAVGAWAAPRPMAVSAVNVVMLPTDEVLVFGPVPRFPSGANSSDAWLWNPRTGEWTEVPPPPGPDGRPLNIWCAGQTLLPDGRVVVVGGNRRYPVGNGDGAVGDGYQGLETVLTFNPWNRTWTRQPDMRHGRWYPSLATLSDGRVVIVGGWDETGREADDPEVEVFTPSTDLDGVGTIRVEPTATRVTQIYPHLFTLPGDRVLMAGPGSEDVAMLDTTRWRWTDLPGMPAERLWGAATLEAFDADSGPRRLLLTNGSDTQVSGQADGRSYVLDVTDPASGWSAAPTMNRGRAHLNVVGLPDGGLLALGGGAGLVGGDLRSGPVFTAETLAEGGTAWNEIPGQTIRRTYHSTAWLLPDGRVVSAGDDKDEVVRDMEVYSPPYLFRGTRPVITRAPAAVEYGQVMHVDTPDPDAVRSVVMRTPTATTHAADMTQRTARLRIVARDATGVDVAAPPAPGGVLPGYQMLFLLDRDGTPSEAAWVRLALPGTLPPAPPADPPPAQGDGGPAPGGGGTVTGGGPALPPAGATPRPQAGRPSPALTVVRVVRSGRTVRVLLRPAAAGRITVSRRAGSRRVTVCRIRVRAGTLAVCRFRAAPRRLSVRFTPASGAAVSLALPAR